MVKVLTWFKILKESQNLSIAEPKTLAVKPPKKGTMLLETKQEFVLRCNLGYRLTL